MSSKEKSVPEKDPYEVLGVAHGASDADIAKAYRKLARKLHPDKQAAKTNLTPAQLEVIKHQFHDIQVARSFLLDPEHAADRKKYETKRASDMLRKQTDQAREKGMSERRKRMREELKRQEAEAEEHKKSKHDKSNDKKKRKSHHYDADGADLEHLSREGQKLREQYANREMEREIRQQQQEMQKKKEELQDCQIRLKWSRKRMKESPSEHSIAKLLSSMGTVVAVEMIGSKGNAALVTFADASSCAKAVDYYADSYEMRATFVGKRKTRAEEEEEKVAEPPLPSKQRKAENDDDWKLRREMEREQLLREMERNDDGEEENRLPKKKQPPPSRRKTAVAPFPPPFPNVPCEEHLTPLERLEKAEATILKDILPMEFIQGMKISK